MTYPTTNPDSPPAYIDIMLDLETLDIKPGAKILSIGAKRFNTDGTLTIPSQHADFNALNEFYVKIDTSEQSQAGYTVNDDTVAWWQEQDAVVSNEAFSGITYLVDVLEDFVYWITHLGTPAIRIWCKGANFDVAIIEYALDDWSMHTPWHYADVRCFRTLSALPFAQKLKPVMQGTAHNALDDAKFQAAWAENIFKYMKDRGIL